MTPTLAIVMPAYNEAGCIREVVGKWLGAFESLGIAASDGRIVVVNDGSRDQTGAILDDVAKRNPAITVIHQANAGHGPALLHAYRAAVHCGAQWVFHVDSDDQFTPTDLPKLWAERQNSKFIIGRRIKRHDPAHRLVITRVVGWLNILLFGRYIPDANIPYRLIEGEYLKRLLTVVPANIFAPNIVLSVLAALDGERLLSIPVEHHERQTGTVSIVRWKLIKVCIRSARELVAFRLQLRASLTHLRA